MRQLFGVQYGRDQVPVPTWSEEFELEDFTNLLNNFLGVGADFRTIFYYQQDTTSDRNAFFQMQGDVYLNFRLARKVNIYLDKGLYSGFEIFGLLTLLPANGFVKIGRFVPNYGTKVDEHRVFVREKTGFSQETGNPYHTGLEVAVSPGPVTVTAGLFNAVDVIGQQTDKEKALLGRAEGMFKISNDMHFGVGGSIFQKKVSGTERTLIGGFGSYSYSDATILGEIDLIKTKVSGATTDALVVYAEADYVLTPGVDVKFIYDFFDRDIDLKSGSVSRYSIGLEFFPISGVEVRPLYRIVKEDPTDIDSDEVHVLIHFYM
jgi:hypothetical protein